MSFAGDDGMEDVEPLRFDENADELLVRFETNLFELAKK